MTLIYRSPDGTDLTTPGQLEAEYDLEASVPDFPAYLERYIADSERARKTLTSELGVPYGPTLAETLDVFPGAAGAPIVIFIHGGYWISLTSEEHSFVAPGLVAAGAAVMVPTYALCPAVTIDDIVRQVRASVAWAYRNGNRYSADTSRIVVVGHSSCGHLVARLLQTDWTGEYGLPDSVVTGGCAISGLFDLRPFPYTSIQRDLRFTADEILRNSPILNLPVSAPHLLITNGARQPRELRRQSADFFRAWSGVGLSAELWERPEFNHFDELDDLTDPESELTQRIVELSRHRGTSV